MQDNEKKPALRFKGFTDPWEQRKLSELTSMHARIGWQNLRTSEFLDSGDYMLITGTDFDDGTVNYSTCHFVERERYEQDKNIQIRNGSILITKDGTLGKVAYVQSLSMPATLNAGVFNVEIRNTSIVDERYLFQYLKAPFLMDYVDKKATGGTIKHLNQNILVDFPVVMPKKTEQVSIGNFFQRIDTLITLHQRKYEKLVNIKKSMLDKMFPKNGASVPEIRFKGFTDLWEQRKLGDISEIKTGPFGSTLHADDYVSDGIPIITTEHFKTGSLPTDKYGLPQVSENDFSRLSAYILNAGDIVFSRVGSVDINALITPFQSTWLFSGRVLRVRPQNKNSSQFLHTLLETEDVKNDIRTRAVGQTMPSINTEILKTTPLRLPESTLEQEQLGKYFLNLDTLITLHQRKLEKLQNIKKSCLEKMFV